jgi:alkaline phosphatase D
MSKSRKSSEQNESKPTRREFVIGGAALTASVLAGCGSESSRTLVDGSSSDASSSDASSSDAPSGDSSSPTADAGAPDAQSEPDAGPALDPESIEERLADFELGVASGDVTDQGVVLWTRTTATAPLELAIWEMDGDEYAREEQRLAVEPVEGFVHVDVGGLASGVSYRYAFFELDGEVRVARSEIGKFRTAPSVDAMVPFVLGATSCMKNTMDNDVLEEARRRTDIDVWAWLGDTSYNDGAVSLSDYRQKWASSFQKTRVRALRRSLSAFSTWDDHEFENNFDPEAANPAQVAAAKQAFFEHQPVRRDSVHPDRVWKKMRWGRTADIFVLDCRTERLPSTRDTDQAQYISREQMDWLKAELMASEAVFKVILNSVPITKMPWFGAQDSDRWEGYPAARSEILSFIDAQSIRGLLWVAGDFHFATAGRVSTSGAGSNQTEVLVGPCAQNGNVASVLCTGPQFDFESTTNNFATLAFDPGAHSVTIDWWGPTGRRVSRQSYSL